MDKFERMFLYQELLPLVYVRYADDVGTVVKNRQEAENTLEYLNSKHPTIKFEMELPSEEGFLPLLDMAVRIDETGHFQRKLFTKIASKGIVLNFASHQPASVKRALVKTEIQRANSISTDEHKKEALERMPTKLQNNGYPRDWIMHSRTIANKDAQQKHLKNRTWLFVSHSYRMSSTVAQSSYLKNTTSLPDL